MNLKLLKDKSFSEQIENSDIINIITFIVAVKNRGFSQWLTLDDDLVVLEEPMLSDDLEYEEWNSEGYIKGITTLMGIKECLRFIALHELLQYHPFVAIIGGIIPKNTNYVQADYEHIGRAFVTEKFIPKYVVKEFKGRADRMKFFDAIYNLDRVDKFRKR